jgi:CRISPR-associated protein Cas2
MRYDIMWLLVLFDAPASSVEEKKAHTRFRNYLLRLGFTRLQWSCYARAYTHEKANEGDRAAIEKATPRGARVRLLTVTDMQFERMTCIDGGRRVQPERKIDRIVVY